MWRRGARDSPELFLMETQDGRLGVMEGGISPQGTAVVNFLLHFKRCSCIQIKRGPLLHMCHSIDTGPAVSILVSSNLCDDTLSYRCIEHSTNI